MNEVEEIKETVVTTPDKETVDTQVVETEKPASRSRTFMQSRYPDAKWDDDEQYENSLADHLENTDKALSDYKANDEAILELLELNPEFALVLEDIGKGIPPRIALERHIGLSELTPEEGDTDWDDFASTRNQRLDAKRKSDEEIAMRTSNLESSNKRLSDFVESKADWEEPKREGFVKFIQDYLYELGRGELTDKTLQMLSDAYTHDEDVAEAAEAGKIEGRNQKITRRIKKESAVDNIPDGGGANPAPEPKPRRKSIINIAQALDLSEDELEQRRKQY